MMAYHSPPSPTVILFHYQAPVLPLYFAWAGTSFALYRTLTCAGNPPALPWVGVRIISRNYTSRAGLIGTDSRRAGSRGPGDGQPLCLHSDFRVRGAVLRWWVPSQRIAERGRRRDPPPALPAGGGIKSAQPRSRRQHDSCFRMTMEKRIELLPVLASFGRRWSVANIFFFFFFLRQWVKVSVGSRGGGGALWRKRL